MEEQQKLRLEMALTEARDTRTARLERYQDVLARLPWGRGSVAEGTHEIASDTTEMEMIEEKSMRAYAERGLDPRDGRAGIVFEDPVSICVGHPIRTADGNGLRTWKAVYWWNGLRGKSVNLVPYTDDGRVLMVPAHRGPVVSRWVLEFPGGGDEKAMEDIQAARLQTFEEAGHEILEFKRLGGDRYFIVDPSTNGTPISLYAVHLGAQVGQRPQQGEVLRKPVLLNRDQLEDAFLHGSITLPEHPGIEFEVLDGRNGMCALQAILHDFVR